MQESAACRRIREHTEPSRQEDSELGSKKQLLAVGDEIVVTASRVKTVKVWDLKQVEKTLKK